LPEANWLDDARRGGNVPDFGNDFAAISGARIEGECVKLPFPVVIAVNGAGKDLEENECGFEKGKYRTWDILSDADLLALVPESAPASSLLDSLATRGIDGGIQVRRVWWQGTSICAEVRIWAEIKVLGKKVSFDETIEGCINVAEPCYTLWEIGWANVKICYRHPNTIVLKLCVGKWGLEKCWEHAEEIDRPRESCPSGEVHSVSTECCG